MNYPKISIVTPNYNKARYLEKTILSVLSQNYPNLEYIIIDGGSTDGSVDIIKKYADQLTYWVSEPDNGMYYAIKKGFERSSGEIMAWIGSDDMYHSNSFFIVAQVFSECPEVSWIVGAQASFDENSRTVKVESSPYFNHLNFLMHQFEWVQQESCFWRRSLYEQIGGISTDYKLAGDFDLWMRFSRHEKMYVIDALIGGFRHSEVQLSKNIDMYYQEVDCIITKEKVSNGERKQIKKITRRFRIISMLKRLKIFNYHAMKSILLKKLVKEELSHRLYFDFNRKKFVIYE